MNVISMGVRAVGIAWIAIVVAFGIYVGFMGVFFRAPGLLTEGGYGDIWLLALIASPGMALVWLGNKMRHSSRK